MFHLRHEHGGRCGGITMPDGADAKRAGCAGTGAEGAFGADRCGLGAPLRGLFAELSSDPLPDQLRALADALDAARRRRSAA